ncbi:MAG TPA: DUF2911 domain-containing protein [Pyrinomonadaceae bacterium]|jgi:hypothetical protein|nr:DUF2911 domain-containing protein [Pyrinomonadaceae bacterium]
MKSTRVSLFALSFLITLTTASLAFAQQPPKVRLPQASPSATVSQTIGVTDISITYHRPAVKGRTLWGDIASDKVAALIKANSVGPAAEGEGTVDGAPGSGKDFPLAPNGHVWRAGANEATKFTVSDDVLIDGQKLAAGAYSLHMIPAKDEFTIIFNKTADQWGSFGYDAKQDALRVKAKPIWTNDSMEQLTYEIPAMTANSAKVILRWDKVAIPFTVEVPNQDALVRAKIDAQIAANPTDWQIPLAVARAYANDDKFEDAIGWVDKSIKVKETFVNLRLKANLLLAMGKKQEAIAVAEQAVARGKAEGADTARFEKVLADLKAGKM